MIRCNDRLHDGARRAAIVLVATAILGASTPASARASAPTVEPAPDSHADEWGDEATTPAPTQPPGSVAPVTATPPPVEQPAPRKKKRVRGIVMMGVGGGLLGAGWATSVLIGGLAAGFGRDDGLYMMIPVAGPIVWFSLLGRDHPDVGAIYVIPAFFLGGLQIAGVSVLAAGAAIHVRDKRASEALGWDVGRPRWAVRTSVRRQLSLAPGGLRLRF
jgi:hypothetical protein